VIDELSQFALRKLLKLIYEMDLVKELVELARKFA